MKKTNAILIACVAAVSLSACDSARKALTQTKAAPDEFEVYTRAPLTLPPDYGLRVPGESEAADAAEGPQQTARRVLLKGAANQAPTIQASTPGTTALLAYAGAHNAEPGIRDIVARETSLYAKEDTSVMESLLYGDEPGRAEALNPSEESKRIQENQALGNPVNEGETEMIDPPKKGLFDGWFN